MMEAMQQEKRMSRKRTPRNSAVFSPFSLHSCDAAAAAAAIAPRQKKNVDNITNTF